MGGVIIVSFPYNSWVKCCVKCYGYIVFFIGCKQVNFSTSTVLCLCPLTPSFMNIYVWPCIRCFYFNTPYFVWRFLTRISFRLLFVGSTAYGDRITIERLSYSISPLKYPLPPWYVLRVMKKKRLMFDQQRFYCCNKELLQLIFTFFDKERENWTRFKHRYARMEKNIGEETPILTLSVQLRMTLTFITKGRNRPLTVQPFIGSWPVGSSNHSTNTWTRGGGRQPRDTFSWFNFIMICSIKKVKKKCVNQIDRDDKLMFVKINSS